MTIDEQLAVYGCTRNARGQVITPRGRLTQVALRQKSGRFEAFSVAKGTDPLRYQKGSPKTLVLWTGFEVGEFLEKFWFLKPLC